MSTAIPASKHPRKDSLAKAAARLGGLVYPFLALTLAVLPLAWRATVGTASAADKAILWKPTEQALLRVDDHPVTDWNVFQEGKKDNPLLLQMGTRFLLVNSRNQTIFELPPDKIRRKGTDLLWDPADRPSKPLATSNWVIRDVGLAYKITTKLVAEGHAIDLQIPHPLDLRSIH